MKKTRHFLVVGRVQGVSFRAYTRRQALEHGLTGWVRNLRDGRVEILATGREEPLSIFHQLVARGPRLAQVLALEVKEIAPPRVFEEFLIEADGEQPWVE